MNHLCFMMSVILGQVNHRGRILTTKLNIYKIRQNKDETKVIAYKTISISITF